MSFGPNVARSWSYLVGVGLSQAGAAGVVGNFLAESGIRSNPPDIDPAARQIGGGPGRGIAQWSVGGRWDGATGLVQFAQQLHQSEWTLGTQLAFTVHELHTFGLWGALSVSSDVAWSAAYVMARFEMPASKDPSGRQAWARQVYGTYAETPPPIPYTLHRTLRQGAEGPDVKSVQARVGVVKYGVYGPLTAAAVVRWQRAHRLVYVDGVVGAETAHSFGWRFAP